MSTLTESSQKPPLLRLSTSEAATALQQGLVVALPTETVYGLAADARNDTAIESLFALKGRPQNHPVIVHVARPEDISDWATEIPEMAWELTEAFWPGPLTLILKRHPNTSLNITGGQDTVAIRMPRHPVMLEVIDRVGHGIVAPSANRFGHISPTLAAHVDAEFAESTQTTLAGLIDGGPCRIGIESTILDISDMRGQGPVLRRPGQITANDLSRIHKSIESTLEHLPQADGHTRVPGNLESHYAPTCPTLLIPSQQLTNHVAPPSLKVGFLGWSQAPKGCHKIITLPATPDAAAEALYSALRELEASCDEIWVEALLARTSEKPPAPWAGLWDRLLKATGGEYKSSPENP